MWKVETDACVNVRRWEAEKEGWVCKQRLKRVDRKHRRGGGGRG